MTKRAFLLLVVWTCILFAPSGRSADLAPPLEPRPTIVQKRQEAAERLQIALKERADREGRAPFFVPLATSVFPTGLGFNPAVDYSKPNYAYSPNLRKFVNAMPGLGAPGCFVSSPPGSGTCNENNLGQYIPIANPDTTTYPQSDYYEIGIAQYQQQMHSDLPAAGTMLRGYYQINAGTIGATSHDKQYLGPLIIAQRDRAVRLKVRNELGIGTAGDLPLPVDPMVMGAGTGPLGGLELYSQNRATVHLHGGLTPWISDGTPHQWFTPAGDPTSYKKGVSFQNVPDMVAGPVCAATPTSACITPSLSDGIGTFYYPNQQSARLMFYHDHAYGITRLNVYAGEAAGYLLTDQVEEDLISGTNVSGVFNGSTPTPILPDLGGSYHYGIPLIIQDRTFVNDASTPVDASFTGTRTPPTSAVDPNWTWGGGGSFWFPHEYMPNENIFDPSGYNVMGRWDYAPWMIPPMPARNPMLPSPTIVPEAFLDTPVVNGTAFPYVSLPPTAVRLRILNACNDRMLNLQIYRADPDHPTEVKMVPAAPNSVYPTWPRDGRDGGVPDPTTAGPDFIQIGNEAGFLAKVAVIPQQPVDFDYNRRSVTFGGVTSKTLLLPPAVRADVIVDLSGYQEGDTLILYNDAPAPMPLFDARNDLFTDDPDMTEIGGPPPSPAGFGPNNRTILQIRIAGSPPPPVFDLAALQTMLPKAFAIAQDPPLVPQSAYNLAYGAVYPDVFASSVDESLNVTGLPQPVARVVTEFPGLGYTTPPTVSFVGGGGTGALAVASLNGVIGATLVSGGTGYTSAPAVTITGGGGTGATAVATVSGGVVTVVTITNPGANYTTTPTIAITGGGGTGAAAIAQITIGSVGSITLLNPGSGYTSTPRVILVGGGGTGAVAVAVLAGALVMNGKNMTEGFDMEFGRMNAVLGSTPSPLAPTVGAGPVLGAAFYIDPPTEILDAGKTVLWRIMHLGVDSHALHFHLFNVQVINRVDWTNTIKPPYDDEVGWKETIRTNPFEDIIVALRPATMSLPFQIPPSNRLLDPTTPAGSTTNFLPVAPPPGVPAVAQTRNVMTNFGGEYVWHCHLLGHEENDMMRPIVLVTRSISGLVRTAGGAPIAGVTMTLSGTATGSTTTNAQGQYTLAGLADGPYVVTPSSAAHTFSPVNRPVTIAGADVTGRNFTGTPLPAITVTSPNGGELWGAGLTQTLRWTYVGSPGSSVRIELLKGGALDSVITSSTSIGTGGAGSFNWPIPASKSPGVEYRIRVTSTSNAAYGDTSNANFSILSPSVTVTSPNGGESWPAGTLQTVRWTTTGNPGASVRIDLLKAGVVNATIAPSTLTAPGSYAWTIPGTLTPDVDYAIRVTSTTNAAYTDTSDAAFTIATTPPSITVLRPNGGESWAVGTPHTIQWAYVGNPGTTVRIELLRGGVFNRMLATAAPIGTGGAGSFSWSVLSSQATGSNYRIRITSTTNPAFTDTSNANFTLRY